MKNKRDRLYKSFTLYRKGETEKKTNIIFEMVGLLFFLAISTVLLHFGYVKFMKAAYPMEYNDYVTAYAEKYYFEPSLIYAIIHTESGFRPNAVSSANAMGLMQIKKDTFEWAQSRSPEKEELTTKELFNPEINIHYGVLTLSLLRGEFDDTPTFLAAYNAGIGSVWRWLKNPDCSDDGMMLKYIPYEETRNYIIKVQKAKSMYEKLYNID
ncbi:MAG: lytic transglycosylase domain-containing protein [Oscillospiraceae bacterium]|nr:lytic transglycosylase domain-containing protein [Oscillospiraceae bacterium]MDD4414604.1 lytic transglycosylase domain-containing protein [Oscillospiraceae bacterium]